MSTSGVNGAGLCRTFTTAAAAFAAVVVASACAVDVIPAASPCVDGAQGCEGPGDAGDAGSGDVGGGNNGNNGNNGASDVAEDPGRREDVQGDPVMADVPAPDVAPDVGDPTDETVYPNGLLYVEDGADITPVSVRSSDGKIHVFGTRFESGGQRQAQRWTFDDALELTESEFSFAPRDITTTAGAYDVGTNRWSYTGTYALDPERREGFVRVPGLEIGDIESDGWGLRRREDVLLTAIMHDLAQDLDRVVAVGAGRNALGVLEGLVLFIDRQAGQLMQPRAISVDGGLSLQAVTLLSGGDVVVAGLTINPRRLFVERSNLDGRVWSHDIELGFDVANVVSVNQAGDMLFIVGNVSVDNDIPPTGFVLSLDMSDENVEISNAIRFREMTIHAADVDDEGVVLVGSSADNGPQRGWLAAVDHALNASGQVHLEFEGEASSATAVTLSRTGIIVAGWTREDDVRALFLVTQPRNNQSECLGLDNLSLDRLGSELKSEESEEREVQLTLTPATLTPVNVSLDVARVCE